MPCEVCKDTAKIEVDGHIFCPKCYESYYKLQPGGCDWKPYKDKEKKVAKIRKDIDLWDTLLELK